MAQRNQDDVELEGGGGLFDGLQCGARDVAGDSLRTLNDGVAAVVLKEGHFGSGAEGSVTGARLLRPVAIVGGVADEDVGFGEVGGVLGGDRHGDRGLWWDGGEGGAGG